MDGRAHPPTLIKTPTWRFTAYVLGAPFAAGAAAIAGALVANETGVGVALALLASIYAWGLAYESAIRRMPTGYRIGWVLTGLVISAAVAFAVFLVFFAIAFSMTDWS